MFRIVLLGLLLATVLLHANTPFNLEEITELKINLVDENSLLKPEQKKQIINAITERFHKVGISTKAHGISTLYIKIEEESDVISILMFVGEEVRVKRNGTAIHTFAFTYMFHDMFLPEALFKDVYDSIVNYELGLFLEQYHLDNEEF